MSNLMKCVGGNRVVPCGRTDRQTELTKPIVDFRNFANAPTANFGFVVKR